MLSKIQVDIQRQILSRNWTMMAERRRTCAYEAHRRSASLADLLRWRNRLRWTAAACARFAREEARLIRLDRRIWEAEQAELNHPITEAEIQLATEILQREGVDPREKLIYAIKTLRDNGISRMSLRRCKEIAEAVRDR